MTANIEDNHVLVENHLVEDGYYFNNELMIKVTINYPSFISNDFKSFVKFLNNLYYSKLVLHSKYEIYRLYRIAVSDYEYAISNNFPFRSFEYYIDYHITYNDNCTLSIYYDTYVYTGGAHGATVRRSDTWDLKEARLTSLSDYIVDKENYREFVINEVLSVIDSSIENDELIYFSDYRDLVGQTFNKDSFYLFDSQKETNADMINNLQGGKGGIVIYFQQYDIGPYSSGIQSFLIPFDNPNIIGPSC